MLSKWDVAAKIGVGVYRVDGVVDSPTYRCQCRVATNGTIAVNMAVNKRKAAQPEQKVGSSPPKLLVQLPATLV